MTTQTEHSPFPSDETLAAYIDGRLDPETRERVTEHLAECPECFEVLRVSREMNAPAPAVVHEFRWPRKIVVPLAAAAVLGGVVFLTPQIRERIFPRDDIRALADVAPEKRLSDGRVTGFPYRKRAPTFRGAAEDDNSLDSLAFQKRAADVQERAIKHPDDAQTLHAEGISYLVLGEAPAAVATLEKALKQEKRTDPRLLSDLSAAYLATGNYKKALETANRAWQSSRKPEIAWNRAVAAERAGEINNAKAYWGEYLEVETDPNWSLEARGRLHNLEQPPGE